MSATIASRPPAHVLTLAELDANPWASCGPTSLAAILGRSLAEVRHAFPNQREGRTWTNRFQMQEALDRLGVRWAPTKWDGPVFEWPTRGVAIIQFRGSWDALPVNHPAQLQRSHWIAVAPPMVRSERPGAPQSLVFDVNVCAEDLNGGWVPRELWERTVAPWLAEGFGRKATGAWWVRAGIEATP